MSQNRDLTLQTGAGRRFNTHLLVALALAFVYHGGLLVSGTFKRTYDAYIHIFFADHYARSWFDHWEYRWYTGFPLTSYPPGSQHAIGLLSYFVGLLNGFVIVQLGAVLLVTLGIYRFSRVWVSEEAAGYATLLTIFSSSICETIHVFGQLPTTFSLGFLLNALPYVRRWLEEGGWKNLLAAWSLNAATTAGHHVTTLFGAAFFVAPVIAGVLVEKFRQPLPDEPPFHPARVTRHNLWPLIIRRLRRVLPALVRTALYGVGLIAALVLVVLPYWLWSKADPIQQVPIPHASRDSFIANPNAGLVFWLIPYGLSLLILPYAFYKGLSSRAWPLTLSLAVLFFLGTGGTTPFPKMLLRGSYDILTLDRFTFWATIAVLPLLGEFVVSLLHRGLAEYFQDQFGRLTWRIIQIGLLVCYLAISVIVANFTQFRRFQPAAIDMQPITNFLAKDQHDRWRYMTLGFGDQMAWLSAQTTATSVDGNYHSARRLPEMTTTSVERLEGAKFRGVPGIGSLQQFLAVPEKYNLKFIFSNDQFYDPLLYFSGWHRLQRLENGIMVWEREDIPPLPEVLPRKEIPVYQRVMWGLVPMSAIFTALLVLSNWVWGPVVKRLLRFIGWPGRWGRLPGKIIRFLVKGVKKLAGRRRWPGQKRLGRLRHNLNYAALDRLLLKWSQLSGGEEEEPRTSRRWQFWRDWFVVIKQLKPASSNIRQLRSAGLGLILLIGLATGGLVVLRQANDPVKVVENYYDDLDFRRFDSAYNRLDPAQRPSFELYRLQLSVKNGLVASYSKLDSVVVNVISSEPTRVVVQADAMWITAMTQYPVSTRYTLVKQNDHWFIEPDRPDLAMPPDQFFRQGQVAWYSQGRQQVTDQTTSSADVLDRPELQVLSSRLVKYNDQYMVVGELINTDVNPADLTVTAVLYDAQGQPMTSYNAQSGTIHKILPKEIVPFKVVFEGVAGAAHDETGSLEFQPGQVTPLKLDAPVASFAVYAKAVVTGRDLGRSVAIQNLNLGFSKFNDKPVLNGQLYNMGTQEATIPHLLITYYDQDNRVAWVDDAFVEEAVRPQYDLAFSTPLTPAQQVNSLLLSKDEVVNLSTSGEPALTRWGSWPERVTLPPGLGFASLRVSVHYFTGN